jgi:catechol 2,3-dioxygenase-like lactoylglutathione lyase family enzyme
VQLIEITPTPRTSAPGDSNILGVHMSVVVNDVAASLDFYKRFAGPDLQTWADDAWQTNSGFTQLRGIRDVSYRTASVRLPGSANVLELIGFRGIEQTPYRPVFQDIGLGHVAFLVKDITVVLDRMKQLGITPIGKSGTWTQINPSTRGVYTRDHDGFFIEVIERR